MTETQVGRSVVQQSNVVDHSTSVLSEFNCSLLATSTVHVVRRLQQVHMCRV